MTMTRIPWNNVVNADARRLSQSCFELFFLQNNNTWVVTRLTEVNFAEKSTEHF